MTVDMHAALAASVFFGAHMLEKLRKRVLEREKEKEQREWEKDILDKELLTQLVLHAHRFGQQKLCQDRSKECIQTDPALALEALKKDNLSESVQSVRLSEFKYENDGNAWKCLESELFNAISKTQRAILLLLTHDSNRIYFAYAVILSFPASAKYLLYICPGKIKVLRSVSQLCRKLREEIPFDITQPQVRFQAYMMENWSLRREERLEIAGGSDDKLRVAGTGDKEPAGIVALSQEAQKERGSDDDVQGDAGCNAYGPKTSLEKRVESGLDRNAPECIEEDALMNPCTESGIARTKKSDAELFQDLEITNRYSLQEYSPPALARVGYHSENWRNRNPILHCLSQSIAISSEPEGIQSTVRDESSEDSEEESVAYWNDAINQEIIARVLNDMIERTDTCALKEMTKDGRDVDSHSERDGSESLAKGIAVRYARDHYKEKLGSRVWYELAYLAERLEIENDSVIIRPRFRRLAIPKASRDPCACRDSAESMDSAASIETMDSPKSVKELSPAPARVSNEPAEAGIGPVGRHSSPFHGFHLLPMRPQTALNDENEMSHPARLLIDNDLTSVSKHSPSEMTSFPENRSINSVSLSQKPASASPTAFNPSIPTQDKRLQSLTAEEIRERRLSQLRQQKLQSMGTHDTFPDPYKAIRDGKKPFQKAISQQSNQILEAHEATRNRQSISTVISAKEYPSRLKRPSNRQLMQKAIEFTLLAGSALEKERSAVLQIISESICDHFIVLFRSAKDLKFRALYEFQTDNTQVTKVYGPSGAPALLSASMISQFFKYSSGKKEFMPVETRSFTIKTDACALLDHLLFRHRRTKAQGSLARVLY